MEENLRTVLPCYMIPKPVKIPMVPLLVNGKIDRQALLKRYLFHIFFLFPPYDIWVDVYVTSENVRTHHKFRYDESRKSTFNFGDEDILGYVSSDHFERARLLLNSVAQVLGCTEKPNLGNNFFEIGGDSINMVQVRLWWRRGWWGRWCNQS